MGLLACSSPCKKTLPTEALDRAITEVSKPDSYYLVPCKKPVWLTSDSLEEVILHIEQVYIDYADCYNRHNALSEQLNTTELPDS